MCLMTARFTDECGGAVIMENVTELTQSAAGIELVGLLDEPRRLDGARIVSIDFSRGVMRLSTENAS